MFLGKFTKSYVFQSSYIIKQKQNTDMWCVYYLCFWFKKFEILSWKLLFYIPEAANKLSLLSKFNVKLIMNIKLEAALEVIIYLKYGDSPL